MGSTISGAFNSGLDQAKNGRANFGWMNFAGDQSKPQALDGAGMMGTVNGLMQPSSPMPQPQMQAMQQMRPADFGAQQQAPQQAQMQQPQMMTAQPPLDLGGMQNMLQGGMGQQLADAGARQADEQRRRDYWQRLNQGGAAGLLSLFQV